jgi:hypothetical protein
LRRGLYLIRCVGVLAQVIRPVKVLVGVAASPTLTKESACRTRGRVVGIHGDLSAGFAGSASALLGFALAVLGSAPSGFAWWDNHVLRINIVSALTGTICGISFSAFILYRITASQTDKAQCDPLTASAAADDLIKVIRSPPSTDASA